MTKCRISKMAAGPLAVAVFATSLAGCAESSLVDRNAPNAAKATLSAPDAAAYVSTPESRAIVATMATKFSADNSTGSSTYKVGPFDVIEVSVFQVPDLSKTLQVSETGSINFPLIGETIVEGKSAREIEKMMASKLGADYLRNPQVSVYVREYNSQRITIQGSVKKPGLYPIQGRLSLLQLMALAGDMDSNSDDTVVIFRTVDGRRGAIRYNVSQVQSGTADDPQLQAGDIVVAGKSAFKEGLGMVLKVLPLTSVFTIL